MLLVSRSLSLLVPAWDLGSREVAEVNTTLAGTNIALALATTLETAQVHLTSTSLSTRLDTAEEGSKVNHELVLFDTEIVVKQVEKLLLHQVDLGLGEERCVLGPVLVLRRRVVEVLGSDDESGEEDTVTSAVHSLSNTRKPRPQTLKVDESAEEGGNLNVRPLDQESDEGLQAREAVDLELARRVGLGRSDGAGGRGGRRVRGLGRAALNDVSSLVGQVDDHLASNWALDKVGDGRVVAELGYQAGGVAAKKARVERRGRCRSL